MNANLVGFAALGASLLAFKWTYDNLHDRPANYRFGIFGIFAILAMPSMLFAVYYLHLLPEWSWFYTLRSWRGTELLAIFLGCAGGVTASLLPRRLLRLPLCAVTAVAVLPYMKPIIGPLDDSMMAERWHGDACLQSTLSTCGPASVCTALKYLGTATSEREVAQAAFTYAGGTEAWYLARYVRAKGFIPQFDFRKTFSPTVGLPAVVGVRIGSAGHFIAVLNASADQVTFADPLSGLRKLPTPDFQHLYAFTGFHMTITKPNTTR